MINDQDKPKEYWIETHELIKGKKGPDGFQVWPQVYETQLENTIKVIEYGAYQEKNRRVIETNGFLHEVNKELREAREALRKYQKEDHAEDMTDGYADRFFKQWSSE